MLLPEHEALYSRIRQHLTWNQASDVCLMSFELGNNDPDVLR